MDMAQKGDQKPHCLVVPYPLQGHINPMLQFTKRLQSKGLKATFAATQFIFNTAMAGASGSIAIQTISDGNDSGGHAGAGDMKTYLATFERVGTKTLCELIEKLQDLGDPIDIIVYDSLMPWILDVAKKYGIQGAVFFTQSCAVNNLYYHAYRGSLQLPITGQEVSLPGLPVLEPADLPYLLYAEWSLHPFFFDLAMNQFANIHEADWVLCNTIYELEKEEVDWIAKACSFIPIGPTIPSMYLDKRLEDDKEYGLSIYKPKTEKCINWLNERAFGSVVYVAFGSMAKLNIEQMEEVAWGLRDSKCYFLWVVRGSEEEKLPKTFVEETCDKGLVVTWCPQLDVLSHDSIGCFVTHCGWNSTLEALSLGVPMLGMPQNSDQSTNAKYLVDVWGNGLRPKPNEKGIVRRDQVELCIREIMEGIKGKDIRKNATKWKEVAVKAADEGGSSNGNIDQLVSKLVYA